MSSHDATPTHCGAQAQDVWQCTNMVAERRCETAGVPVAGVMAATWCERLQKRVEEKYKDETEANKQQAASAREYVVKLEDEFQKTRDDIFELVDKSLVKPQDARGNCRVER